MLRNRAAAASADPVPVITRELAALASMTVSELAARHREVYGYPSRSRNKHHLLRRVAWRIQELAEGGLSTSALERIRELGDELPERWRRRLSAAPPDPVPSGAASRSPQIKPRDPRLPPPGSVLRRTFKGTDHEVLVLDDGFQYRGATYTSLSRIAEVITGTRWNGFAFFACGAARPTSEAEKGRPSR